MLSFLNFAVMVFASGGESGGPLDVNPGVIIWTVITFLFLLFVLKKIAWKPILNSLDERENFIKDSIAKAENARDEAQRLLEENKATLARAEEESQKIILQGREYSEKLKSQILEESKEEARKMVVNASAEIERKNKEAFTKLKDQVADIAVLAAEKIIKENLDKDKQSKLVEKYLKEIS